MENFINPKYLLPTNHLSPLLMPIKNGFTQRKIEGAYTTRLLQVRIGWTANQEYNTYLLYNQIYNCMPTGNNINAGDAIYGTLVPILKCKTTLRQPPQSAQVTWVPILSPFLQKHPIERISTDLFFVKGLPYLIMRFGVHHFHGLNCWRVGGKMATPPSWLRTELIH